ncbi:MAG: biotin--[acetyl-CoA-carboxylase] ligase [Immundisolibacteraceae bacterium]|nr:biotin--[acetyl-CoA-carboxylase] ligase [Immundisolibacteraceae bacterium]
MGVIKIQSDIQALQLHWGILTQLADGELHSGQDMAKELSVSRSAIWKALRKLELYGLNVEHRRGVGYRLAAGRLELLSKSRIYDHLRGHQEALNCAFKIFKEVGSTNQYLLDQRLSGPAICLAEYQSAGRGRRGRQWHSPFGSNLYLSVAWPFRGGASELAGLSLAVGVSVNDALTSVGVCGGGLKWPNDLLFGGKKLAGILIDLRGEADGVVWAVIGIGINVLMTDDVDSIIDQPWTSCVEQAGIEISRNQLAGEVIKALFKDLPRFESDGFAAFQSRWQELDVLQGQPVWVEQDGKSVRASALGVDGAGGLLVEIEGQRRVINSGEVSVRVAN